MTAPASHVTNDDPVLVIVRVNNDTLAAWREVHFTDEEVAATFVESCQHDPANRRIEAFKLVGCWDREDHPRGDIEVVGQE